MGLKRYEIQLKDHLTGEVILGTGGVCFVATNGGSAKATLKNKDGSSLANPVALNNGRVAFHVDDTVTLVDLYGIAASGQFFELKNVKPGGPNEIAIDKNARHHVMVIPFDVADQAGDNTETASGFSVPSGAMMLPNAAVRVVDLDATETIDVGTQGTSNDPNGFLAALTVATAALHKGTLADGAATLGALLSVDESAGDLVPEGNVSAAAANDPISWTLSAGADTAAGFIILPYMLTGA